jgi:hypothetical protein
MMAETILLGAPGPSKSNIELILDQRIRLS